MIGKAMKGQALS